MIMSGFFLNTRVEGCGTLAQIGDACLTPVRYLWNGRTISGIEGALCTKRSFLKREKNMFKTAAAILLLIPGLILSVTKYFAYFLSSTMRERYTRAAQEDTSYLDKRSSWKD